MRGNGRGEGKGYGMREGEPVPNLEEEKLATLFITRAACRFISKMRTSPQRRNWQTVGRSYR